LNPFAGNGWDAISGDDDANKVERVAGGDAEDSGAIELAGSAEGVDCLGKGELLATESGDEAATADFAASFETTQDAEKIAPLGDVGLAG
jgi:hypothetical protein